MDVSQLVYFIEYGQSDKKPTNEIFFSISFEGISLYKINKLINETNKPLRLYSFTGLEITDESDLDFCKIDTEKNKIIFYTTKNIAFNNQEIIRAFKLANKIGEGGFATVYLAHQKFTNDPYAIKFMKPSSEKNLKNNFIFIELEALRRLNHPHIIKLYNYCLLDDNTIVFVLEYLPRGNLREFMKQSKILDQNTAREIFEQIIETVNFFHSQGILHLDLKPENILLDNDHNIKIIDFGLASLKSNEKFLGGSYRYMPPEWIFNINDEGIPQNDVWSIGVILYELVCGNFPFKGTKSEVKQQLRNLNINPKYPDYISYELHDLLKRIFVYDYKERIKVNEIMNHPWLKGETMDRIESNFVLESTNLKTENEKNKESKKRPSSLESELKKYNKIKIVLQNKNDKAECDENENNKENNVTNENIKRSFKKQKTSHQLPKIKTKLNGDINENLICEHNISIFKNGMSGLPTYLEPIGHSKALKQKLSKIKGFFKNLNEMKEKFDPVNEDNNKNKRRGTVKAHSKYNFGNELKINIQLDEKEPETHRVNEKVLTLKNEKVKTKENKDNNLKKTTKSSFPIFSPERKMKRKSNVFNTVKEGKLESKFHKNFNEQILSKSLKKDFGTVIKTNNSKDFKILFEQNYSHP